VGPGVEQPAPHSRLCVASPALKAAECAGVSASARRTRPVVGLRCIGEEPPASLSAPLALARAGRLAVKLRTREGVAGNVRSTDRSHSPPPPPIVRRTAHLVKGRVYSTRGDAGELGRGPARRQSTGPRRRAHTHAHMHTSTRGRPRAQARAQAGGGDPPKPVRPR